MHVGTITALITASVLVPAATAAAQPPFPQTYRGTISGSLASRDDFQHTTTKATWTITGVALRRTQVRKSDADWSALYKVTGGKISYHESETGDCSYAFDKTLPLRTTLDSISAPFALSQSLFFNHKTTALGLMNVKQGVKVTETCAQPEGEPADTHSKAIHLATLFDPGERQLELGRRFAAKNGYVDDSQRGRTTTKWSWVLKPGR